MTSPLNRRALAVLPGGVNSPVRAFKAVGCEPIFVKQACGARLETINGQSLIDFCMSFGPLILGHAQPAVTAAIVEAAKRGTSFAVTSEAEIELAELIKSAIPSMERLRLVSSGTEAAMTAVRLARGFTGRSKILKFSGCYHGHADSLLVQAGSGMAGIARASSAGVPEVLARETLVSPFNDREAVRRLVAEHGGELAAILVEPVAANMGLVLPDENFLADLRMLASSCGALLVFDEVITGFRLTFGGYQNVCHVTPDLTCLGKIIGGGLPIGAVGGRAEVMEQLSPLGPVYQAGTLSGNPISVAAGLAVLKELRVHLPYQELAKTTEGFVSELRQIAIKQGLTLTIPYLGSMFCLFFRHGNPCCFEQVLESDQRLFSSLFSKLLERGVYLPPSPFEVCFISKAHDQEVIDQALVAFAESLK